MSSTNECKELLQVFIGNIELLCEKIPSFSEQGCNKLNGAEESEVAYFGRWYENKGSKRVEYLRDFLCPDDDDCYDKILLQNDILEGCRAVKTLDIICSGIIEAVSSVYEWCRDYERLHDDTQNNHYEFGEFCLTEGPMLFSNANRRQSEYEKIKVLPDKGETFLLKENIRYEDRWRYEKCI